MKRKEFLGKACPVLILAMMNTPLLVSCSKESDPDPTDNSALDLIGESGFYYADQTLLVNIEHIDFKELQSPGSFINHAPQGVLILRKDATTILAFDNCCPHQGSTNQWSFNGSNFRCSNHGNSYGIGSTTIANCNSNTITGNLKQFEAILEESLITIKF